MSAAGGDSDAIHKNVSGEIVGIADKGTPGAADHLLIEDAAADNAKRDITIGSLEPALEGVLDLSDLQGLLPNSKLATMASRTLKGNTTLGVAAPVDLTATEATAMLNPFSSTLQGLVASQRRGHRQLPAGRWAVGGAAWRHGRWGDRRGQAGHSRVRQWCHLGD